MRTPQKRTITVCLLLVAAGLGAALTWPRPLILTDQFLSSLLLDGVLARSVSGSFRVRPESLPARPGVYRMRFVDSPGWSFDYRPASDVLLDGREVEVRLTARGDALRGLRAFTCDEIGGVRVDKTELRCTGLLWDRPEPPPTSPPETLIRRR